MSQHSIMLHSATAQGRIMVVAGYTNGIRGPHFFCSLIDATEPNSHLWNSQFSLEHMRAQSPDEFDEILTEWGVTLPGFIKRALEEDWAKDLKSPVEYCWQDDGSFDQIV